MRSKGTAMLALILALCIAMLLPAATVAEGQSGVDWAEETRAKLRVGSPTELRGRFFTRMWGGTTSDLDVQDLLHGYSPVCYDIEKGIFRFDHSVLQDATALDDAAGNRTYILVFYNDLKWSDGTRITASDYAFSILFCMNPAIRETGGKPMDYSWIDGAEAYLSGESETLAGLRILNDQILQIRVRADALPYFYELSRLAIHPYPASVIAPGIGATDEGNGAKLTGKLTAEIIRETVLDPEKGYLTHPAIVSGPYTLESYDWPTAVFRINPFFKGTEEGKIPRIGELEYTLAENDDMITRLENGEFGLLNKVTMSESIQNGLQNQETDSHAYTADNYARTGLTMIWFTEGSFPIQEAAVRKAIAYCFDRESFIGDYTGTYGIRVDGLYGIGQWMYRMAAGIMKTPENENLTETEQQEAIQAFSGLNLNGLTRYDPDTERAAAILDAAGWKKEKDGVRSKEINGIRTELKLKLGLPESEETRTCLEKHFVRPLEEAGIRVTMQQMSMEEIEKVYRGETGDADLIYLGENFSIVFDPEILAPLGEVTPEADAENSLRAAKTEIYRMTEPDDTAGFLRKWVAMQERITETLPLIPVYSNVYFDFYTRELHDYRITEAVTWGEAIVESYMSDIEMRTESE